MKITNFHNLYLLMCDKYSSESYVNNNNKYISISKIIRSYLLIYLKLFAFQ